MERAWERGFGWGETRNVVAARLQVVLGWLVMKMQVVFAPVNTAGFWHSHGEKVQGILWRGVLAVCVLGRGADAVPAAPGRWSFCSVVQGFP